MLFFTQFNNILDRCLRTVRNNFCRKAFFAAWLRSCFSYLLQYLPAAAVLIPWLMSYTLASFHRAASRAALPYPLLVQIPLRPPCRRRTAKTPARPGRGPRCRSSPKQKHYRKTAVEGCSSCDSLSCN